jgi:protein gp37
MNKNTSINWPGLTHTFNPVVGCLRGCCKATHGFNCYAKIFHQRFNKTPFNKIQVKHNGFYIPKSKNPRKIFVGSMSDICFWSNDSILNLIAAMLKNKYDTFMLLTKNPTVYAHYVWPENVMCGTTVTFFQVDKFGKYFQNQLFKAAQAPRPFLSIEPLLGIVPRFYYSEFELVIVGKDNTRGAKPPQPEWIQSAKDQIPYEKTWWKQ